jgi:hypothetical protein
LPENIAQKYGGALFYEPDPIVAAKQIFDRLNVKRQALGLEAFFEYENSCPQFYGPFVILIDQGYLD